MENNGYFNASSVRMMRYLYALGFDKESFINRQGFENWRFQKTELLQESVDFYFTMRRKNKVLIGEK